MTTNELPTTALTGHVDYPTVEKFRAFAYYNEVTNTELYTKAMEFAAKHPDFERYIKSGTMTTQQPTAKASK